MTWMCGAARAMQQDATARRVQLAAMCPGAIASNIARHTPYCAGLVTFIMKMLFPSPYKAAAPVVWMALADELPLTPGQPIYYQHLWQPVRARLCLHTTRCNSPTRCPAESAVAPRLAPRGRRARALRHERRDQEPGLVIAASVHRGGKYVAAQLGAVPVCGMGPAPCSTTT